MSSIYGNSIKISIFGESHGEGIGVVIDNFPAGIYFDEDFIGSELERRRPCKNLASTKRNEPDKFSVLSGIYNNHTTGTPISAIIKNTNTQSKDYKNLNDIPRPSHADYTGDIRYKGYNDPRGGGHFSGRLTAPLCFAGALCQLYLKEIGVSVGSHILSIANVYDEAFDMCNISKELLESLKKMEYSVIDEVAKDNMLRLIEENRLESDSVGGVIEACVIGLKAGVGSPMFNGIESKISSILFSVPAVKGVEFGLGFDITKLKGSEANDNFYLDNGVVKTTTNHNAGINGGISNGMPIVVKTAIKPTPSISKEQSTLNITTNSIESLSIVGRHDPCIVTRANAVIENALAIAITDLIMESKSYE